MSSTRLGRWGMLLFALSCAQHEAPDRIELLQQRVVRRIEPSLQSDVEIPFAIDDSIRRAVDERLGPGGGGSRRAEEVLELIFSELDLSYARAPTRSAVETFESGQGNCLSFVNLFVGVARYRGLDPFYVEVEDYQRWNYEEGVVLSRGHIVAGLYTQGVLRTFDFLPYRPKGYRRLKPIDDTLAMAHYYNNLGAEALLAGDLVDAERHLSVAHSLAPGFEKAANNLGILHLRSGRLDEAVELYANALADHPESVPLLTNLARAYQRQGNAEAADRLMRRLDRLRQTSPFFLLYRASEALAAGDTDLALEHARRALRADRDLPEVHFTLARIYLARTRLQRARHHLDRALGLDPSYEEARDLAARMRSVEHVAVPH